MLASDILCVYLFTCFAKQLGSNVCTKFCDCYEAPENGIGPGKVHSYVCEKTSTGTDFRDSLANFAFKSEINTFVFKNVQDGSDFSAHIGKNLAITNLVFIQCLEVTYNGIENFLTNVNIDELNVLTFIDSRIGYYENEINFDAVNFPWRYFSSFTNVKVVHVKGGELVAIKQDMNVFPAKNVITLHLENNNLDTIHPDALVNFKALKMLTIILNNIETLDWMENIQLDQLWYLDLRSNRLGSVSLILAQKLSSLKTLKLGQNNLHSLSEETMLYFMNHLNEFSFQPMPIKDNPDKRNFLYSTKEMQYIPDVVNKANTYAAYPYHLYGSLKNMWCIKWSQTQPITSSYCANYEADDFDTEYFDHVTTYMTANDGEVFSYKYREIWFSGAEFENHQADYKHLIGNVIKMRIDFNKWNLNSVNELLLKDVEDFLQLGMRNNFFVIITLWDNSEQQLKDLLDDISADKNDLFTKFLQNILEPMARRLNKYSSLFAWNVFELPEMQIDGDNLPGCADNRVKKYSGSGTFKAQVLQKFIAKQASILHTTEPRKLVTVTLENNYALYSYVENDLGFNFLEDACISLTMQHSVDQQQFIDFYTVNLLDQSPKYVDASIYCPSCLSEDSKKPIVLQLPAIAPDNVGEYFQFQINDYYLGILGTIVKPDDESAKAYINAMRILKESVDGKDQVVGPKYDNTIGKEAI